jgi:hypothetical protein
MLPGNNQSYTETQSNERCCLSILPIATGASGWAVSITHTRCSPGLSYLPSFARGDCVAFVSDFNLGFGDLSDCEALICSLYVSWALVRSTESIPYIARLLCDGTNLRERREVKGKQGSGVSPLRVTQRWNLPVAKSTVHPSYLLLREYGVLPSAHTFRITLQSSYTHRVTGLSVEETVYVRLRYVIYSVGNLMEEKSCVRMFEIPTYI